MTLDFEFKARRQKLNWKKLALMDVDQVMNKVSLLIQTNIEQIVDFMENVAFCNIEAESTAFNARRL